MRLTLPIKRKPPENAEIILEALEKLPILSSTASEQSLDVAEPLVVDLLESTVSTHLVQCVIEFLEQLLVALLDGHAVEVVGNDKIKRRQIHALKAFCVKEVLVDGTVIEHCEATALIEFQKGIRSRIEGTHRRAGIRFITNRAALSRFRRKAICFLGL